MVTLLFTHSSKYFHIQSLTAINISIHSKSRGHSLLYTFAYKDTFNVTHYYEHLHTQSITAINICIHIVTLVVTHYYKYLHTVQGHSPCHSQIYTSINICLQPYKDTLQVTRYYKHLRTWTLSRSLTDIKTFKHLSAITSIKHIPPAV